MEIQSLLSGDSVDVSANDTQRSNASMSPIIISNMTSQNSTLARSESRGSAKRVCFELLLRDASQHTARLPMRVDIYSHDSTDSIITTVKNFFGLYDGSGVSFQDVDGNTIIGTYENFSDNQTVHVRVVETGPNQLSPRRPRLASAFEMLPNSAIGPSISRPSSQSARKRSVSPVSVSGQRSHSVSTNKSRAKRSRVGSVHGDNEGDSDSDVGNASVTSSRRGRNDIVAPADISVDNIVEGGRRKRARFDSSELPLFVPTQVALPASISSVSPQRKTGPYNAVSPYQHSNNQNFSYSVLPSPQSYDYRSYNQPPQARVSTYPGRRSISANGIVLPTPDPTIGSVISDEDVALQLMRLGEYSNHGSAYGRTSTSTLDDALSGKAAASSSDESDISDDSANATDNTEDEDGEKPAKRPRIRTNGSKSLKRKLKIKSESSKSLLTPSMPSPVKGGLPPNHPNLSFQHFQNPLAEDEEDLSTKPRCQRCRKSKKGCDRQRPCGRCRDAGIGVEGCVSEDEGNGRKGRYGRHMGVPIKKAGEGEPFDDAIPHSPMGPPPMMVAGEKSRKRKR